MDSRRENQIGTSGRQSERSTLPTWTRPNMPGSRLSRADADDPPSAFWTPIAMSHFRTRTPIRAYRSPRLQFGCSCSHIVQVAPALGRRLDYAGVDAASRRAFSSRRILGTVAPASHIPGSGDRIGSKSSGGSQPCNRFARKQSADTERLRTSHPLMPAAAEKRERKSLSLVAAHLIDKYLFAALLR